MYIPFYGTYTLLVDISYQKVINISLGLFHVLIDKTD